MRALKPKKRKKYKRKPGPKKKKWTAPVPKYKIIIVTNRHRKNVLFTTDVKHDAILKFRDLREENVVDFPKRFTTAKDEIIPVKYEILFLKRNDDKVKTKNRMVYNELGLLVEEKVKSGKWGILESAPYEIEETFNVFGFDGIRDRLTVKDIITRVLFKDMTKNNIKTVFVINHRLIIKDTDMDIIECKCNKDAIRLHNVLRDLTFKNKIKKFFFYGEVIPYKEKAIIFDEIEAKTNWKRWKVIFKTSKGSTTKSIR